MVGFRLFRMPVAPRSYSSLQWPDCRSFGNICVRASETRSQYHGFPQEGKPMAECSGRRARGGGFKPYKGPERCVFWPGNERVKLQCPQLASDGVMLFPEVVRCQLRRGPMPTRLCGPIRIGPNLCQWRAFSAASSGHPGATLGEPPGGSPGPFPGVPQLSACLVTVILPARE